MKIRYRMTIFSLIIPAILAAMMITLGLVAISQVVYDLNKKLLEEEIGLVRDRLHQEYQVLVAAGVESLPNYQSAAQAEFLRMVRENRFQTTGFLLILDRDGRVLQGDLAQTRLMGTMLPVDFARDSGHGSATLEIGEGEYFSVYLKEPVWNWTLVQLLPKATMYSARNRYLQLVLLLSLGILALSLTLSNLFSRQVADRIDRTLKVVNRVGLGDFTLRLKPRRTGDEIGQLQQGIDAMSSSLEGHDEALQAAKDKFQSLVEASTDWIWEVDIDGRYTYASPRVLDLLGYEAHEVVGRTPFDLMPEDEAAAMRALFEAHVRDGQPFTGLINRNVHREGREVILETSARPIHDEQGRLTGFRGIDRDITERVREVERREAFQAKVQHAQKLESLGVLAGGIAHDFNNLLMAVLGNVDMALLDLPGHSKAADCVKEIKKATIRATELAEQMLAYSGKGKFEVQVIDLSELVQEMGRMLDVSISKKAILKYNFHPGLPAVEVDVTQIRQVVLNLITNASDAIGARSGVISISTGVTRITGDKPSYQTGGGELEPGLYVTLEVADTGCGMDSDTVARVFDPFFTTKFTGRGLGMAAILGIIRGHEGAIGIESEPGKGTTVRMLLPAQEVEATALPRESDFDSTLPPSTILLVDDDESIRSITGRILERFGMTVLTATDGQNALEVYEKEREHIDCVIMDLTMPRLDGQQAFFKLQKMDPQVRVIIASGYSEIETAERFLGQDIAGFLKKPFQIKTLRNMLSSVLMGAES